MWNSYESYTSDKRSPAGSRVFATILKLIVFVFIFLLILPVFFIGTLSFETSSMEPVFQPGDRAAYSPLAYGPKIFDLRLPGLGKPLRGDLVVIKPPWFPEKTFWQTVFDPIVKFFTLRNMTATADKRGRTVSERTVVRVVGLPGDTIRIDGDRIFVRPENAQEFVSETSLAPHPYTPKTMGSGTGDDLLFREVKEFVIKEGEYFLVGDNRDLYSDSRFQGAMPFSAIQGKVFLRYWPFDRFGTP